MNKVKVGLAGYFTVEQKSASGETKFKSRFKNLIMDEGLILHGTFNGGTCYGDCALNNDTSEPQPTETASTSDLSFRNDQSLLDRYTSFSAPDYGFSVTRRMEFPVLTEAMDVSSVLTLYWTGSAASRALFSRSLIKDESGIPVTLSGEVGDIFIVTYQVDYVADGGGSSGTISFSGNKGGPYDWRMIPANANTIATSPGNLGSNNFSFSASSRSTSALRFYSGTLGSPDGLPEGSYISTNTDTTGTGQDLSSQFKYRITYAHGFRSANTDIRTAVQRIGPFCYQIEFTPAIQKTDEDTLSLTFEVEWSRL